MLTSNQSRILEYVAATIRLNGIAPTMREAANETGLSLTGARYVLISLERLGYIKLRPRKFRSISVIRWPDEVKSAAAE